MRFFYLVCQRLKARPFDFPFISWQSACIWCLLISPWCNISLFLEEEKKCCTTSHLDRTLLRPFAFHHLADCTYDTTFDILGSWHWLMATSQLARSCQQVQVIIICIELENVWGLCPCTITLKTIPRDFMNKAFFTIKIGYWFLSWHYEHFSHWCFKWSNLVPKVDMQFLSLTQSLYFHASVMWPKTFENYFLCCKIGLTCAILSLTQEGNNLSMVKSNKFITLEKRIVWASLEARKLSMVL